MERARSAEPRTARLRPSVSLVVALLATVAFAGSAGAALSQRGGTGVVDLMSAESKRTATLELGFFSSYQNLSLRDTADTHLNQVVGGAHAVLGLSNGFELWGSLPFFANYTSAGSGDSPFDQNVSIRLGDLTGALRWTGPLGPPGLRWGAEAGVILPIGDDKEETYPGRAPTKPYTLEQTSWRGRGLLTWDGLRAGAGFPLRLHANAAYLILKDEDRYWVPDSPLPLELPAPVRKRDNDVLSYGGGFELDFPRVTIFGEVLTHQLVNQRSLLRGKENLTVVTPGVRFWLPGGVSLLGAYSFSIAEDDPSTAFNPDAAFPDGQAKISLSLGSVYRGASARDEPQPLPPPAAATPEELEKLRKDRELIERREVQEERAAPSPKGMPGGTPPAARPAPARGAFTDTDGDGIPDAQDACPLVAEDWDGFQDLDGCPDLDNDQDGVPDNRDACPNEPEVFNGYKDADGCPDVLPSFSGAVADSADSTALAERSGQAAGGFVQRSPVPTRPPPVSPPSSAAPGDVVPSPAAPGRMTALDTASPSSPDSAEVDRAALALRARIAALEERQERTLELLAAAERARHARDTTQATATSEGVDRAEALRVQNEILSLQLEIERRRRAEAENRLRSADRGEVNVVPGGTTRTVVTPPQTTVISPRSGDEVSEARFAALQAEILALRAELADRGDADADTGAESEQLALIAERLGAIQTQMDSLAAPSEPVLVEAEDPERDPALEALDLTLPVGEARVYPEIQFATASDELRPRAVETISEVANLVRAVPASHLTVLGHTDAVGREDANLELSRRRAESVASALVSFGVRPAQVSAVGLGESRPIADNATPEGRRMNRRVEFRRNR